MIEVYLCTDQVETSTFPPPPPGQTPGIWIFENWIVQIPAPSGKNGVQMPYLWSDLSVKSAPP